VARRQRASGATFPGMLPHVRPSRGEACDRYGSFRRAAARTDSSAGVPVGTTLCAAILRGSGLGSLRRRGARGEEALRFPGRLWGPSAPDPHGSRPGVRAAGLLEFPVRPYSAPALALGRDLFLDAASSAFPPLESVLPCFRLHTAPAPLC